ncbi:unnamed protein product [Hyaloperonospora brassicae]|uniref:J domain-containing protein n=1 Tax=Hyaloperonospora brassicae TaxID=162125 RepID=A0AAV0V0J7_HYABA|nr:unnamed protein product [Hyaloperonospora brassicae]
MGVISVGASLGVRPARASGLSSPSTSEPAAVDRCARRSCASSKPTTTASTRAVPSDRPKPLKRREPCASSGSAAARRGTPERSRPRRASSDTPASVMSRGSSQPLKKSKTLPRVQGMDVPRDGPHSVDGTSGIHLHQAVNVRPSSDAVRDSTTVTRDEAMEIEARDVADAHTTRSDTGTTERVESDVDDAGRGVSVVRQLPAGGCSYNNNSSSSESHSTGMIHVQLLVSGKNEERGEARTSICSSRDTLQYDARGVAWGITIEDRMLHETYNQQKDDEKRATVCQGGNRRWRGMQADTTTLSPQRQLKCRQEGDFATKEAEEWKSRSVSCGVGEGDTAREKDEKRCLQEKSTILQRRLARSVKISRLLEAEVKLARAHEVLERHKCLQLRRRYEELRHRKKVVELVVKRQCNAMTAALSTTSSSKRKQHMLESERLNVAHNAYPFTTSGIHDSMLRERDGKAKRVNAGKVRTLGLHSTRAGLAKKKDLAHLVKKVQAVESLLTSGLLPRSTIGDPDAMQMQNITAHEEDVLDSADVVECADERLNMDTSNANEIVIDVSTGEPAVSSRKQSEEKRNDRRDVFRSTRDLPFPGLTRDLNLIQDYTLETDCKLLRFLAGKRQYFYLEPLMTGSAYSIEEKQWLLSAHDIQILHRFLLDNANFGNEVVVYAERLRALGNLVPPLSTSPSRNSLSGELGVFGSSRHKEWSELQNKIVNLHSLALIAHMLGKHYLSRHAVCGNRRKNDVIFDDILGEDTLKSDLFTYILRPIRSSAIESSLFDSLPISLVRETIEHCPEVVNHVLQWKSKNDVPEYLRKIDPCNPLVHGVTSATVSEQVHPGNSYFLRNLLLRLTTYARDLDAAIKALVATLKEKIPTCQKDRANYASLRRERIIAHVNLLTSVTAHVVAENTKLQLHKWWVLFFEHSCAWFNPGGVDEVDDRSYDKFTCLQDALYIWHNKALLYTTQDDFVDCKHPGELALDQHEGSAVNGEYCRSSGSLSYGSMPTGANISLSLRDEDEAALLQSTPASMRDAVQNRPFSREDAKQCMMTSRSVEKARCELEESLARTRDSMNELGRAGPWRTHVKDFNALTRELAKQFAIQKKLVKSQWARHYTKYNEFYLPLATKDASLDRRDADMALLAGTGSQAQDKLIAEDGANAAASIGIDWTNVYDPDKDAPDVIEVKKLRHEITLAKEQLLREIDAQHRDTNVLMDTIHDNSKSASDRGDSTDLSSTCGAVPSRYLHGRLGPLPTFDYGIDGAFGLGPFDQRGQYRTWRPAPLDKNEQEDLFRAARVRMKLVRSTFAKRMGLASGSGCLDGEQLWQPDRIQMMWERRDFHGVLGLPRDAPVQQIKRQYRKLALKLHPDKASDTSVSLESTVAEAGRRVGVGSSGERVDAFVAATQSYKILLGDVDSVHGLG